MGDLGAVGGRFSSSPCQACSLGDPVLDPRVGTHLQVKHEVSLQGGARDRRTKEGVEGVLLASATRKEWPFLEWGMLGGGRLGCRVCFLGPLQTGGVTQRK